MPGVRHRHLNKYCLEEERDVLATFYHEQKEQLPQQKVRTVCIFATFPAMPVVTLSKHTFAVENFFEL